MKPILTPPPLTPHSLNPTSTPPPTPKPTRIRPHRGGAFRPPGATATSVGGVNDQVYEAKASAINTPKMPIAKFIANKTEAPMALVRQKTVAAGDAIVKALSAKGPLAKPYMQKVVDVVRGGRG